MPSLVVPTSLGTIIRFVPPSSGVLTRVCNEKWHAYHEGRSHTWLSWPLISDMWLDRLATTPSGTPLPWSRAASPAAVRRSSHLSTTAATVTSDARRPGLPQRLTASALVNGSNGTSFSPSKVSTSSLRTVLTSDPSTSVESDSLGTLRGLFKLSNAHTSTLDAVPDKDDFGSSSLEAFADVDSLDSHKGHEDIGRMLPRPRLIQS